MSRGLDNCNPGNMHRSRVRYRGEVRPSRDPDFKQFKSPAWGYRAVFLLLHTYAVRHGGDTLAGMIACWAPPAELSTQAYIRYVAQATGIAPRERVDTLDPRTMLPVARAISHRENGTAADPKTLARGWELFVGDYGKQQGKKVRKRHTRRAGPDEVALPAGARAGERNRKDKEADWKVQIVAAWEPDLETESFKPMSHLSRAGFRPRPERGKALCRFSAEVRFAVDKRAEHGAGDRSYEGTRANRTKQ